MLMRSTDLYGIPEDRMGHILAYSGKFHCPAVQHQCGTSVSLSRVVANESLSMDRIGSAHGRIRTLHFSRHAACRARVLVDRDFRGFHLLFVRDQPRS